MFLTAGKIAEVMTALQNHSGVTLTGTSAAASATTGAISIPANNSVVTVTPTGAITFNAASVGIPTQQMVFLITTSGVTSYVLTWGTNFKSAGTLATGVTSGKVWSVSFMSNGVNWNEIGRTGPL